MNRVLGVLACLVVVSLPVAAESGYQLKLETDLIVGVAALGVAIPSLFIEGIACEKKPYEDINLADKSLMFAYGKTLDDVSTIGAYLALMIPGVTVMGKLTDVNALLTYGAMYGEAFLLTLGTKDLLKAAVSRNRPYTYLGSIPIEEEDDYFNSFPSGHTAFAFLGATFFATTLSFEYPSAKWRVPAISLGYALAAGIGTLRVLSGNHFPTDVLGGAIIGSFYGWLIPRMHLEHNEKRMGISIAPKPNGFAVGLSFP